jgi:two-component system LytT family response regulator
MTTDNILLLPTCKGIEVIDIRSIVRIEAISNYSKLFFTNGKTLVVAKVLHWFERHLSTEWEGFLRIHRSHLVNTTFISEYIKGTGAKVKLHNGEIIDISKRKKNYFLEYWHAIM